MKIIACGGLKRSQVCPQMVHLHACELGRKQSGSRNRSLDFIAPKRHYNFWKGITSQILPKGGSWNLNYQQKFLQPSLYLLSCVWRKFILIEGSWRRRRLTTRGREEEERFNSRESDGSTNNEPRSGRNVGPMEKIVWCDGVGIPKEGLALAYGQTTYLPTCRNTYRPAYWSTCKGEGEPAN